MNSPTEAERKDWWLKVYARVSIAHSLETCRLLLACVRETTEPLYLPLCVSMHALYGRPFKKQNTVGKLAADYVPTAYTAMHVGLLTMRDKLMVHTDGDEISAAGRPLHDVVYSNLDGNRTFSTHDPRPRLQYFREVSTYLPVLLDKICRDIVVIHERFGDLIPSEEGDFVLNTSGPELFAKFVRHSPNMTFQAPTAPAA